MCREIQGRLQAALGDHQAALETYGQWQALTVELTALDPEQTFHQGMLAESHQCIGDLRRETGDPSAAIWAYRQAHEIVRLLAEADPADVDLQIQLARILSSLGGALIETGELTEAQNRLADARSIQESVLADAPDHARARDGLVVTTRRLARLATENSVIGSDSP